MTSNKPLAVVILAAGIGSRMKSKKPKVLHEIAGVPMIEHVHETARMLGADKIVTVIGPAMEDVRAAVEPSPCFIQADRKGTADAVKTALPELENFKGDVLILYADVPLVSEQTLQLLVDHHKGGGFGVTILAMAPQNPQGYGRVLQNADGTLKGIVEDRDASEEQRAIRLCNSGLMIIKGAKIADWIARIENKNAQNEYYLTDLPSIVQQDGGACGVIRGDYMELRGVNSREQLATLERFAQDVLRHRAMDGGVTLLDPETVYFSWDTKLGQDVVVGQNVVFGPGVDVGEGCKILPFSHIEGAKIENGASVGPFARIRPKSVIGENASVGNFIEVNRSTLYADVKAKHVSYLGDAVIEEKSNIGAGTVIANYDGFEKHETHIGKEVFIGSNSTLIAPVKIGKGAVVAGGSTINENIPEDALGIARGSVEIKKGWAVQYRDKKSKKKKSA